MAKDRNEIPAFKIKGRLENHDKLTYIYKLYRLYDILIRLG